MPMDSDEGHDLSGLASYSAGDTVVLNSGGPLLTIAEIRGDKAVCLWFDAQDALSSAEIPTVCLLPSDPFDLGGEDDEDDHADAGHHEDDHGGKKKKKKKNRDHDDV